MKIKTHIPLKTILTSFILLTFMDISCLAQEEKKKDDYQSSFDEFKKNIEQDFKTFKDKNDSIFYEFLKESWFSYESFFNEKPEMPKPEEQPVQTRETEEPIRIIPKDTPVIKSESAPTPKSTTEPGALKGLEEFKSMATLERINYYGEAIPLYFPYSAMPKLKDFSERGFADFYLDLANVSDLDYFLYLTEQSALEWNLNDWGYMTMLKEASTKIYQDENEQILFLWFGLTKSGYKVKVGYDRQKVYLLASSAQPIYTYYFNINNVLYYLISFGKVPEITGKLVSFPAEYPGETHSISLMIYDLPVFKTIVEKEFRFSEKTIKVTINKGLTDYFLTYPDCDLDIPLNTSLSRESLQSLDSFFRPVMENMNEVDKVNALLRFIQYSVPYKIDQQQFGYENYLFAEETLYYPYSDCEDRAALLAQLVQHFTGLKCIGLAYPEHVSLAVRFNDSVIGDYVDYQGEKYYVCDPTYIGALSGMSMPDLKNVKPEILVIK